jgi:hypothetical protein
MGDELALLIPLETNGAPILGDHEGGLHRGVRGGSHVLRYS